MAGKFQLKKAANGEFHFNLLASNGQVILQSEMYKTKASASNGIESVMKNAAEAGRFEARQSSSGKHYFVLKAGNNQVIGQSQMYQSEASMQGGIESVQKQSVGATVEDLSA